jgi:molybdate transport system ATP-binding protein
MILSVHIRKTLPGFTLQADFETADPADAAAPLALLGPSGCGKSMTLKCIAGIETPDSGCISLNGKNRQEHEGRSLFDSSRRISLTPQKRRVGYMFQDYALFPNMTVRKNVLAGMGRHPDPRCADPYLEQFRIADLAERFPGELSEGQKQRTAMARIIAQNPDVILLDEPFSALDTALKWQLEEEMLQILDEVRKPAIFVSHDIGEVFRMSKEVCTIKDGKTSGKIPAEEFRAQLMEGSCGLMPGWRILPAERSYSESF